MDRIFSVDGVRVMFTDELPESIEAVFKDREGEFPPAMLINMRLSWEKQLTILEYGLRDLKENNEITLELESV